MSQVIDFADFELTRLAPEPWGSRLTRARESAGLTMREVEDVLRPHVSQSGLARLEARDQVPTRSVDRGRAVMVLILCGVDPADFGLGPEDVPPVIDLRQLYELGFRTGSR